MEFFRYEWVQYASVDYDGDYVVSSFPDPKLVLRRYELIKETEKGYWIGYKSINYKKWIPKESRKRYAYPTKEEAIENFKARTKRRIEILERTVSCCKIALNLANSKTDKID